MKSPKKLVKKRATSAEASLDESTRFLSTAALFAGDFSVDWVQSLAGLKTSSILQAVEEGVKQGLLVRKKPGFYCFAAPEKREEMLVAFGPKEKEELHRKAAGILLKETVDEHEKPLVITAHLRHVQNDLEGCRLLLHAGRLHRKAFHHDQALQCYLKAIEDLRRLDGEEAHSLFAETAFEYSKIATATPDTESAISLLKEASNLAKNIGNKSTEALLEMHVAKNEWLRSRFDTALEHFSKGWSLAKDNVDPKLMKSVATFGAFFPYWQGRFGDVVENYENTVPEVEKYPKGRFPLEAAATIGTCYGYVGQLTQGLGMLDAIRNHCHKIGDHYTASTAAAGMGLVLLAYRHNGDAITYLEEAKEEGDKANNTLAAIVSILALACSYYRQNSLDEALSYLRQFLVLRNHAQITLRHVPYLMELCWAMELKKLPQVGGLTLEEEIQSTMREKNVFTQGIGYRYLALLRKRAGRSHNEVLEHLRSSEKLLQESAHQIELALTRLELTREHLLNGDEKTAAANAEKAAKVLFSLNRSLVPDDLRSIIKELRADENLLKQILKLSQEVVTIRDNKELVNHIISTVNKITGAERGAIFLLEDDKRSSALTLRAAKNLTAEEVNHPTFSSSAKIIRESIAAGKGLVWEMDSVKNSRSRSGDSIRSCICVPMKLRDRIVGILYHDNRLFKSAFAESNLETLDYFAAQAAIAMDNARAYEEIQNLNTKLKMEKQYYEEQYLETLQSDEFVGRSQGIARVRALIKQVAETDATVLILGETGVGKELTARAIHRESHRAGNAFIPVQCGALPENLITSELFGHERGAFTGASTRRAGRFELANGGTIFLDEIADIPLEVQVRLLRVLETKKFERVGGTETLQSDFRLLAATNRDLREEVKANRFRPDLFYRLNVFPVFVPPLRERKEDIPLLAFHFLKAYTAKLGKPSKEIPSSEVEKLMDYKWPGNVRELKNVIERAAILSNGPYLKLPEIGSARFASLSTDDIVSLEENERRHILRALQKTKGKVMGREGAAEVLNIHPSTLRSRMKKLGIFPSRSFSQASQQ